MFLSSGDRYSIHFVPHKETILHFVPHKETVNGERYKSMLAEKLLTAMTIHGCSIFRLRRIPSIGHEVASKQRRQSSTMAWEFTRSESHWKFMGYVEEKSCCKNTVKH